MSVTLGIEIRPIWFDDDILEVRIRASNGTFAGQADVYASHDALPSFARTLKGFPADPTETRDIQLGAFGPENGGGGVRLHFRCKDRVGHIAIDVVVESDHGGRSQPDSATLTVNVEASGIDGFARQLLAVGTTRSGSAVLPGLA